MDPETTEKKTYKARCHCGIIKFTVAIPSLETGATKVNSCNCSICTKNGYLLVYALRSDVVFQRGEDKLAEYSFGRADVPHRFCPTCATSILLDFKNTPVGGEEQRRKLGVNIRTFDDVEDILDKIQYTYFDGKNMIGPPYNKDD